MRSIPGPHLIPAHSHICPLPFAVSKIPRALGYTMGTVPRHPRHPMVPYLALPGPRLTVAASTRNNVRTDTSEVEVVSTPRLVSCNLRALVARPLLPGPARMKLGSCLSCLCLWLCLGMAGIGNMERHDTTSYAHTGEHWPALHKKHSSGKMRVGRTQAFAFPILRDSAVRV